MLDYSAVIEALRKLDPLAYQASMGGDTLVNPTTARLVLRDLRHTGCLVIRFANPKSELKRDNLVTFLEGEFAQCPDDNIKKAFRSHVSDAGIIEECYRTISNSMKQSEIWKLAPEAQAWAMLKSATEKSQDLKVRINQAITKSASALGQGFPLDPTQIKLETEAGIQVDPENAEAAIIESTGSTLSLLGHINNWFDKTTGELILPIKPDFIGEDTVNSNLHTLLSLQWKRVERAWDRARFFEKHLSKAPYISEIEEVEKREVVTGDDPDPREVFDHISLNRLTRIAYEKFMLNGGLNTPRSSKKAIDISSSIQIEDYISTYEQVATEILCDVYCLPTDDQSQQFAGISLRNWIRGYAFYECLAYSDEGNPISSIENISYSYLVGALTKIGIPADQASAFINLTTFQNSLIDLYDSPLLKVNDGSFRFFAPAFHSPAISVIILSRIGSINRSRNKDAEKSIPVQFQDKGKKFENKILKLFEDNGIPAKTFSYKIEKDTFECDVVALVDETLFIFECKNYNIPLGRISELSHFLSSQKGFKKQVLRNVSHFEDDPEILRSKFGPEFKWKKIVPCILQALPWSMGLVDDVYYYDQSALIRLVTEGKIGFHSFDRGREHPPKSHYSLNLRGDTFPTQDELLRELENPFQIRFHSAGWDIRRILLPISNNLAINLPEWHQRALSFEEQFLASGLSPEEIQDILLATSGPKIPVIANAISKAFNPIPHPKQNRNSRCACGSGMKHKNCCGKA